MKRGSFKPAPDEVGGAALQPQQAEGDLADCVVVSARAETCGDGRDTRARSRQATLKRVRWLCNESSLTRVVLHAFMHRGAASADHALARDLLDELATRLLRTGYQVGCTPFGHLCERRLNVYGGSLTKIYKRI